MFLVALLVSCGNAPKIRKNYSLAALSFNSRVERLLEILFDPTDDKLIGFDRVDVHTYRQEWRIRNGTEFVMLSVVNGVTYIVSDARISTDVTGNTRFKGNYLTALENNGFFYLDRINDKTVYGYSNGVFNAIAEIEESIEKGYLSVIQITIRPMTGL